MGLHLSPSMLDEVWPPPVLKAMLIMEEVIDLGDLPSTLVYLGEMQWRAFGTYGDDNATLTANPAQSLAAHGLDCSRRLRRAFGFAWRRVKVALQVGIRTRAPASGE